MARHTVDLSQWTCLPVGDASCFVARSKYDITRDFVREINPEITTIFIKEIFCSYPKNKVVNITFLPDECTDRLVDAFVRRRFGVVIHPLVMGILHEVGHIMTYNEQLARERAIIYYMLRLDFDYNRFYEFTNMYFAIPSEFEATRWGVEYYLSHKEQCDNFLKEIGYEVE